MQPFLFLIVRQSENKEAGARLKMKNIMVKFVNQLEATVRAAHQAGMLHTNIKLGAGEGRGIAE